MKPLRYTWVLALAWLTIHASARSCASAAEPPPIEGPVSPQESLQHLVVERGLKVELVANEPNIVDPVAIRFDEDGRLWVVEMRDYPTATKDGPRSRISVLKDQDGDGFFESATVFADGLPYATGIQPWKGGVFVTLAGKVVYMKDTNGDVRADINETWFTGFAEANTQLRANHPRLALDNHIYVASGLRGGKIVNHRRPEAKPVSISGRDFRFDPLTGQCEAVSGCGQFGLTFDDYGNRFLCENRHPAMHVVLEDRDIRMNPLYAPPAVVQNVAKAGEESRVYPIAKSWTTSNLHAGQFTAACGLEIYRGDALPREYYGNIFVCEPTGHLVHREIMRPKGVTFESTPAHEGTEFLASRDPWFSPVNLEIGPDGALYVVDMYRAVIEHPEWMPDELRKRPDLLYGNDRGRIYRVVPQDFQRPSAPQLTGHPSDFLIKLLAQPNAWWRETAARLLLEREDKTVAPRLQRLACKHRSPLARIHAIRLLNSLGLVDRDTLVVLLRDRDPRVLEHVIVAGDAQTQKPAEWRTVLRGFAEGNDPRLRFQSLFALQSTSFVPRQPADSWELDAMLIAAGKHGGDFLDALLADRQALQKNVSDPQQFIAALARLAAASRDDEQIQLAVDSLVADADFAGAGLTSLFAELSRHGSSFADVWARLSIPSQRNLDVVLEAAYRDATDAKRTDTARCEAIDLLAATGGADDLFLPLALSDASQSVRLRSIAALAKCADIKSWQQILAAFANETPAVRSAILDGTLASPERTAMLLDEVAADRIRASQIDINHVNRLLQHRDKEIQIRAKELFAASVPQDRQQALADYRPVLTITANPARGRAIFTKQCATCHRIDDVGTNVAPDISDSREKSAEQLLTDILQPNRAIDANYFSYAATTTEGVTHTGILTAETSTSITLREAEGNTVTFRREEIDELASSGVSLMPEGLERLIPPQDMADLISFIKNWRYLDDSPIIQAPER